MGQDDDQIGFDDIVLSELYVKRCRKHYSQMLIVDRVEQLNMKPTGELLVVGNRCRIHVMLSIDDFMPISVIGKQNQMVVSQLRRRGWFRIVRNRHSSGLPVEKRVTKCWNSDRRVCSCDAISSVMSITINEHDVCNRLFSI